MHMHFSMNINNNQYGVVSKGIAKEYQGGERYVATKFWNKRMEILGFEKGSK